MWARSLSEYWGAVDEQGSCESRQAPTSLDNSRVFEAKGRKHCSDKALRPRAPQS